MMPILMTFLKVWWKQLAVGFIIISLFAYIAILKHQRNVATLALQSYKLQIEQQRVAQQLENARIAKESEQIKSQQAADYLNQLNGIRDYYEKISTKNSTIISTLNDKLRQQGVSYRERLSKVLETTSTSTESWRNGDATTIREYTKTLEEACAITTLDYNAIYNAWSAECELKGCQ